MIIHRIKAKASFTKEADELLRLETHVFQNDLRRESYDSALRSRGLPVEVTASDVMRAKGLMRAGRRPITSSTDFLLKVYIIVGMCMFVAGLGYPRLKRILEESSPIDRASFTMSLAGVALAALAAFMRHYLNVRRQSREIVLSSKFQTTGFRGWKSKRSTQS